jgi:hypothetical protein
MKYEAAIVEQLKQSQFICSACGAARDCDCNAPAMKRLAELEAREAAERERQRQKAKEHREKKKAEQNQESRSGTLDDAEASAAERKALYAEGLDGKTRKVPEKKAAVPDPNDPDHHEPGDYWAGADCGGNWCIHRVTGKWVRSHGNRKRSLTPRPSIPRRKLRRGLSARL